MLKKAGIIVAASAAGLLALSPLAFAADKSDNDKNDSGYSASYRDNGQQDMHEDKDKDKDKDKHKGDGCSHDQSATGMGYGGGLVNVLPLGVAANVGLLDCTEINLLSNKVG